MSSNKNTMSRGVRQALYKYLPGSWVDFTQSGGGVTYAVHVDRWNSVHLTDINNKRLLRIVNQRVSEFKSESPDGAASVVNFSSVINEENYYVLTPKISEQERAIVTSVKPWVFVCNSCGRVRQYYSYDEFKRREYEPCDVCRKHMIQLKYIRFCKCGYADGIYVPKCVKCGNTKHMSRRGSGMDFACSKCGTRATVSFYCPECNQKLDTKPSNDSSHFFPFTLSLIDLLDRRKDVFLDNEEENRGEKLVIGQYLGLIPQEEYKEIVAKGNITQEDEFEITLQKEAENLRLGGLDEATIAIVLDAKRRSNPSGKIFEAIERVGQGLSVVSTDDIKPIAEEILEYDELVNARVVLSLEAAERDAEIVNDGIKPDYVGISKALGFSNVQICSGVPIVFAAYGYTRKERECQEEGVKLHGFPQEMEKKNIYATRLETEGVLFELDRRRVLNWLLENRLIQNEDLPQDMSDYGIKMWFLDRVRLNRITPFTSIDEIDAYGLITKRVYTLIHSISHALINEASEICGLDKSSLSEYILPNIPAVFVYCSNSQGFNMGALYSAFQSHFDGWLKHAKERSKKCIFDPICIDKEKACAGCLFLNEVSCQHFNKDLDRGFLSGYFDKLKQEKLTGFWED